MKKTSIKLIIVIILLLIVLLALYLKNNHQNKELPKNESNIQKNNEAKEDPLTTALKNEKYFIENNLNRYLLYAEENDLPANKIITNVNANLDKKRYEDVEETDITAGNLILVNKYYYLTENYVPEDLVTLSSAYNTGANSKMCKEAAEHFMEMSDAALLDNIIIKNASGYRSYKYQENLYNNYVKRDGKEAADTYSARAGYSEHQTGLTSDINQIDDGFEKTDAFKWLQKNAYKYGFILRFPKDKEEITGYKYESWHYRYVGLEAAKQIYEEDLTLEEYVAYYLQKERK